MFSLGETSRVSNQGGSRTAPTCWAMIQLKQHMDHFNSEQTP